MAELSKTDESVIKKIVNVGLPITAIISITIWCFRIIAPFVTPVVWGLVLAITLHSLQAHLARLLRGRDVWAAAIMVIIILALIVVPAIWLLGATFNELKEVLARYREGGIALPSPPASISAWPLIGTRLFEIWTEASTDFEMFVKHYNEQIKQLLQFLVGTVASGSKGVLLLIVATIISGVILAYKKEATDFIFRFFNKLAGEKGKQLVVTSATTIRNVAKGILGVAILQALLVGGGLAVAGVPGAGLLALCCLFLAVIQVGMLPVSLGVIIYAFSSMSLLPAILLTVWMVFVGLIDNVLKPLVMGKGSTVPMLIIFLGSVGGFILSGFIGLFTGSIVLSLGYTLFHSWLYKSEENVAEQ